MHAPRLLLLPGWQDSDPGHWQSRWEQLHGAQRVQQDDWWWPRRGDWMARLEDTLLADERPAVLIAHSLGCQLVAAWAGHSRQVGRVKGALLVALPDVEQADMPPQLQAWAPMPRTRLPFETVAVVSDDDPYCAIERGRALAADWGSRIVALRGAGHVNTATGLGDWADGWHLVQELASAAMQRTASAPGAR
jgi:predicted alpha/beta hydrolase family esterase